MTVHQIDYAPALGLTRSTERRRLGFSYAEVLLATFLIATALVPLMESLSTGLAAGEYHSRAASEHYHLLALFEEVLTESYPILVQSATAAGGPTIPSVYSDSGGVADRRIVYLAPYDVKNLDGDDDPFTGGDDTTIWIKVSMAASGASLETLTWE